MQVRDGMTPAVLVVGPGHTLRQTARLMRERKVGAAVVHDDGGQGPSILTERDILDAVALGQDLETEVAGDHLTANAVVADPDWSLDEAASAMLRGGFRHLIVSEAGSVVGVLSMRDIVGCWSRHRQPA
ncbi:MAG TPA: CBS domain-containing protein [Frankiaceae bacterium]|nr:CBS domain-containing protein [Frankiaceae bacterium]